MFVLVALFLGVYLIRVNYTFMVIGITVMVSLLYAQLGEFSWSLLLLRLVETAVGVGAVAVTVMVIFPLRPQRVLTTGVLMWFQAFSRLTQASLDRLTGTPPEPADDGDDAPSTLELIRDQDAAYAAFEATAAPLRAATYGRNATQLAEVRAVSAAARSYARSLAAEADEVGDLGETELLRAAAQFKASTAAIESRIETGEHGTYTRSAALVELAARSLPPGDSPARSALRDLTLLDGALARLAQALEMQVADLDTSVPA